MKAAKQRTETHAVTPVVVQPIPASTPTAAVTAAMEHQAKAQAKLDKYERLHSEAVLEQQNATEVLQSTEPDAPEYKAHVASKAAAAENVTDLAGRITTAKQALAEAKEAVAVANGASSKEQVAKLDAEIAEVEAECKAAAMTHAREQAARIVKIQEVRAAANKLEGKNPWEVRGPGTFQNSLGYEMHAGMNLPELDKRWQWYSALRNTDHTKACEWLITGKK